VLFSGFADELEDLTPDERDMLVRYAFQHSALRAKRPVVWIPRDKLGVSDDEIKRAKKMSTVNVPASLEEKDRSGDEDGSTVEKTNIWMSNEGTALDGKGRVVFRRSPPDFSNVDLISL
jgi:calcium permeable stress-gated cation channel